MGYRRKSSYEAKTGGPKVHAKTTSRPSREDERDSRDDGGRESSDRGRDSGGYAKSSRPRESEGEVELIRIGSIKTPKSGGKDYGEIYLDKNYGQELVIENGDRIFFSTKVPENAPDFVVSTMYLKKKDR